MNEKIIQTQYDVTKKSRVRQFYEAYKIYIISFVVVFFVLLISYIFLTEIKENKKTKLSNNYVSAKILLDKDKIEEAKNLLIENILANDNTYSPLSLFLVVDESLIGDKKEISDLFEHVIENCKFDKEMENLILFKKALHDSSYIDENTLLETLNPLIHKETIWKHHALLLIGNYFREKNENIKAREFYLQIMGMKNLSNNIYEQARSQLLLLGNE
tara:strand:- start:17186 stop:17833 length:648 start_codon:yes stop_codon:yes gene_type:complete